MKKRAKDLESSGSPRRVLARVLADDLAGLYGSATWTRLDGTSPDEQEPVTGSDISEASTNETASDYSE